MVKALVLNATYEPLCVVAARRAVVLVLVEKADMLRHDDGVLRSQFLAVPVPSVIRLRDFVRVPRRRRVSPSRRAVFMRDDHTCQYCGATAENIDHVIPRSKGGPHVWENVVASCRRCNGSKENRTPQEAGLRLLTKPMPPRQHTLIAALAGSVHPDWMEFLAG
jgi:5-methylcytosine-specific restriction endonuclease McrA